MIRGVEHTNDLMFRNMQPPYMPEPETTVTQALAGLLRHPVRTFFLCWNWKAALFSAIYRAPIFFAMSMSQGLRTAFGGTLLETCLNGAGAGLYGTFLQAIRNARPRWLATLLATCAIPALIQLTLQPLHRAAGTSKLHGGILASIVLSIVSAAFNLYAMRRGALLTGPDRTSLVQDVLGLPVIAYDFSIAIPRKLVRLFRHGRPRAHSDEGK